MWESLSEEIRLQELPPVQGKDALGVAPEEDPAVPRERREQCPS